MLAQEAWLHLPFKGMATMTSQDMNMSSTRGLSYSHLLKEGEFAQIIRSAGQMMLDGGVDCCSNH